MLHATAFSMAVCFCPTAGYGALPGAASGLFTLIKDRLPGGASRLAALLLPQILPVSSVVAPCDPGAARRNPVLVQREQATSQRAARTPDIHFVPTRHVVADAMLKLAGVRTDDVVYDLGSGDGRIVILAAQKYGARGVGVELDPRLLEISRQVAREGEVAHRVTFVEGDLFATDISEATVVTLYLSASVNRQLEPKLRRELHPGTRIVSHQFRIGDWIPDEAIRAEDGTELFLWTIPAR